MSQIITPISAGSEDSRPPLSPWLSRLILLALCVPLFFVGLGVPPLIDPDEPVYAATGLAALRAGTFSAWWSPHYNGALWFDKPPLTYWLIGFSEWLLGPTPFAARLPSAICAVFVVFLSALAAERLWPQSKNAGLWAGIVIASCFQTVVLARAAVTDMILAALLTGAFIGIWSWLAESSKVRPLLIAGVLTGFATLTKGPVAIVLVGGTVLFYLLITRQFIRLLAPQLWLSLVVAIAISLPWYVSMVHLHGGLFIDGFLEANNLTRYLQPEHPQTSSLFWFFPVLLGFIFPWTVPLICALAAGVVAARKGDSASLYSVIWVLWVFIFFSLSQTKLLTYIYPLYPVAAALIGKWIVSAATRKQKIVFGLVFSLVALLIAVILPNYVAHGNGLSAAGPILDQLCVVFLAFAIAVGISMLPAFQSRPAIRQAVFWAPAVCIALFFSMVALAPLWHLDVPDLALTKVAAYIKSNTPNTQVTVAFTLKRPSLVFYSERNILFTDDPQIAASCLVKNPNTLFALKTKYLNSLILQFPKHHYKIVLHSGPNYVLIKNS